MQPAVLWLVRLGLDQGLFTREQAIAVRKALGDNAEVVDFAQRLIDDGYVENVDGLENLAGVAMTKAEKHVPLSDPFTPSNETSVPFSRAIASGPARPAAATASSSSAAASAPQAPPGPAPKFAFDQVTALDDPNLAAAFRDLLRATARFGASDLHISTGARPFVRKNRALAYLSDHVLTADDALRLNTILLSDEQKKVFLERKDLDYALALDAGDRYRGNLMFH
jgi:twitching motility protein PilT